MVADVLNKEDIFEIISQVSDPEIPALSVIEMGMIRDVIISGNDVEVIITPTYSGCPAMHQITEDVRKVLFEEGIDAKITTRLSPPWTTDWMSEETLEKLRLSGIAPPKSKSKDIDPDNLFSIIKVPSQVECPFCLSQNTKILSEYGSTACKSFHYCNDCLQAFDHFKCH
ncbi:MAG: phenylacetate-CoA oxygenase subunit PaaJ [Candidatus Kapabacteria bacterium]|nr:phenylacetate-CoA oxygenase subunit PaaJ [Ignavibacteriota bacterium]MCW5885881.1 phenylacetate-CoA oxygenase subunit PaaJ [Candidatus Kapabacteria bacterium]